MFICRVTGTVIATRKDARFTATKLLIVHPVNLDGEPEGKHDMLALDPRFDAGMGDIVLVAKEGAVAQQLMNDEPVPTNVIVLGVVDDWSVEVDE